MRKLSLAVLLAALLLVPATSALAKPAVERVDEPAFFIVFDSEQHLVVFGNITRDAFCTWALDEEFDGDPPVEQLVPVQYVTTGQGAVVLRFDTAVPIELWQPDPDVPEEGGPGPCEDTDEQDGPWASGTARWRANDNDIDVSLTRTNAFGGSVQATVTDVEGARWDYRQRFRALVTRDDEFRLLFERSTLRPAR